MVGDTFAHVKRKRGGEECSQSCWPTRIFIDHRCVDGMADDSSRFVYRAGGVQRPRCLSSFKNKTKTDQ